MVKVLATSVFLFHCGIISFILIAPFKYPNSYSLKDDKKLWLLLHIVGSSSLMIHWALNSDACCLTLLESKLCGITEQDSFLNNFISPIYKITNKTFSKLSWYVTSTLSFVYKLYKLNNT